MRIESIGSAISNAAGALGKAGVGIAEKGAAAPLLSGFTEMGPAHLSAVPDVGGSVGSLGDFKASAPINIFGAKLTAPTESIISEGPSLLKNNMRVQTSVFNSLGEIRFTSQAEPKGGVLNGENTVEPVRAEVPDYVLNPDQNKTIIEPAVVPVAIPKGLEYPAPQILVSPQPALKEEAAEEEKVLTTQDQQDETEAEEIEDTVVSKVKIVESVSTSEKRKAVIKAAVKRAIELGITVKKALTGEFWRLKSPLVEERKDWTIDLTAEELNIDPAKFSNANEAEEASLVSVANNVPLEEGEGGKQATVGQVRKVTHGEDDKLKSKTPAEKVVVRTIKKEVEKSKHGGEVFRVLENRAEEKVKENTLEDLNLEGVFQAA